MNLYKVYIILAAGFILFTAGTLIINPSYSDFLFAEDGIMEISGLAIAALTMVLAFILWYKAYKKRGAWRFWLILSILSFLFIGESISWGERIFNLKMPIIAGVTFDALHDILAVSIGIIKRVRDYILNIGISDPRSIAIILFSAAFLSIFIYFIVKYTARNWVNILGFLKKNLKKAPFRFLFIALVLIAIALIVDEDNLVGFPHKEVVDEGLELLAILAFLFSCVCGFIGGYWGFKNEGPFNIS